MFKPFQYISALIENHSLHRLINRANKYSNIIIDLEDSIIDINDRTKTRLLRSKARQNLRNLFNDDFDIEIGIRINSIDSIEFDLDIALLEELSCINWKYIVLPKIETHIELQQYLYRLEGIDFQELIICIESEKGVEQLNSILKNNRSKLISKVQFGHFDYFLNLNTFPIPNQTEPLFWKTCKNIIQIVESNGYNYLHSPVNILNSKKIINSVLGELKNTCKHKFGFATVSLNQSICLFNNKEGLHEPLVIVRRPNENLTTYAKTIKHLYQDKKKKEFSFNHKNENGQFIPPQEYISAINFLTNSETEIKIGFIGGCAINQRNIPKEDRIIETFKTKMESNSLTKLSFTFLGYSNFTQLEKSVERITTKQKIDILILHIRPQPFLFLSKFFIKYSNNNNKVSLAINPLLYKKSQYQIKENNAPPVFNEIVSKPTFMSENLLLGKMFGINKRASKLIFNTISKIQSKCLQNNIQLIILGISPQLMTKQGNLICKTLNDYLIKKCRTEKIQYCDSFSKMNHHDYFLSDKLHLSKKGHNSLGSTLYEGMKHFTTQNKQH